VKIHLAYKCHDLGRMEFYSRFTPLGLGTITAVLRREGFDATLVNLSAWSWPKVKRFFETERPDIIGVSAFTFNRHEAMRVAALARAANPRCLVVAGGPHATHLPHHLLERYPQIDLVARGEGEETMLEIVRAAASGTLQRPDRGAGALLGADLAGAGAEGPPPIAGLSYRTTAGCRNTPERPVIRELDRLPHPGADPHLVGVDAESQFEFVITSRGCPAACTFCSSPEFWGRGLRFRSAAHMIEEVRILRERHGVVYLSIRDDTFTAHRQRVLDFCRGLEESGIDLLWDCQSRVNIVDEERLVAMRRAGCTHIQYGVESGSPRMIERLNKGITVEEIRRAAALTRRAGLGLSIYLITGIDGETDEDLASTVRLIEEIRPHDGLVSPLTVYPGTGLADEARRRHGLTDDFWIRSTDEAYFVRDDPWTRRAVRTLRSTLRRVGREAAYGPEDFDSQRRLVGDCATLRLSRGEDAERRGRLLLARDEYAALLSAHPRSLWARMRLGHIATLRRRFAEAVEHYEAALAVVPAFRHAARLLGAARRDAKRAGQARAAAPVSASTRLTRRPMPSIDTITSSPGASGPTPSGVPVATTSPGSRVITREM
jgi:anaerobic magnesium-protoporphyrin IX monomethyl ester cyclase